MMDKNKTRRKIITLVIHLASIGLIVFAAARIYPRVMSIKEHANRFIEAANELYTMVQKKDWDIEKGKILIADASIEMEIVQSAVQPYYGVLKRLSKLPWIGKHSGQVEPIIEYASHNINIIESLIKIADPIAESPVYSKHSSEFIQQINENQSLVDEAAEELKQTDIYYQQIQLDLYPGNVQDKLEKIEQLRPVLNDGIELLKLVPEITGVKKPVTYLVMLQNSDELRPTGGFITVFGLIRLEQGVVTLLDFQDSTSSNSNYISEVIDAPEPMKQIFLAHYWLPRDANWSPSFPESAKDVQKLYFLSTGIHTDGVIALNQSSLEKVLQVTGPVNIQGEPISAENVKKYMIEEKIEAINEGKSKDRKRFITPLVKALINQISQQSGKENLKKYIQLVQNLANQGDVLIYSNDDRIQAMISKYRVDGELQPGNKDYLMLVDANIGYSKIDSIIRRSLKYSVNLSDPGKITSRVEVSYENPMDGSVTCRQGGDQRSKTEEAYLKPSCYWDYWRVLGAKGTLISNYSVPSFSDSSFLPGYGWSHSPEVKDSSECVNEVAGLVIIPTKSKTSIMLDRILPKTVLEISGDRSTYTLNIQKQPGIDKLPVEIEILPPSGAILDYSDSEIKLTESDGKWIWKGNIVNSLTKVKISY
jgi:hypothetical protein